MVLRLQPGTAIPRPVLRPVCRRGARGGWRGSEAVVLEVTPNPMTPYVQAIALTGFTGVMTAAAFEDFRRLVIPNLLPIALCVLWPGYFAAAPTLYRRACATGRRAPRVSAPRT